MNLVPKEEIQKRAASSALIGVLHPTIAMTRMRLQELILINNPHLKNNSFVTSHKKLSILLTRALFFASIEGLMLGMSMNGERLEPSQEEPILFEDAFSIDPNDESVGKDYIEAEVFEGYALQMYKRGQDFEKFKDQILTQSQLMDQLLNQQQFVERGFSGTQLYFRRLDISRSQAGDILPVLSAMLG